MASEPTHAASLDALAKLLSASFSPLQLRQFLQWRAGTEALVHELPEGPMSRADYAHATVLALDRRGQIDTSFITDLCAERSDSRERLREIAQALGIEVEQIAPEDVTSPAVSVQAVLETIVCAVLVLWLIRAGVIASFVLLAPLSLLRTAESTALGVRWYEWLEDWLARRHLLTPEGDAPEVDASPRAPFRQAAEAALLLVGAFFIRMGATIKHPATSPRAIYANFRFVLLCLNLQASPELVPNTRSYSIRQTYVAFLVLSVILLLIAGMAIVCFAIAFGIDGISGIGGFANVTRHGSFGALFIRAISFALGLGVLYVVATVAGAYVRSALLGGLSLCSRVFLKGSIVGWGPLILAANLSLERRMPLEVLIEFSRQSAAARMIRLMAWLVVAAAVFKAAGVQLPDGFICRDASACAVPHLRGASFGFTVGAAAVILIRHYLVIDIGDFLVRSERLSPARLRVAVEMLSTTVRVLVAAAAFGIVYAWLVD